VRRGWHRLVRLARGCSRGRVGRGNLVEGHPIAVAGRVVGVGVRRIVAVAGTGLAGDLVAGPIVGVVEEERRSLVVGIGLVGREGVAILLAGVGRLVLASWEGGRRRTGLVGGRGEDCRTCLVWWG
jgi:hypothetical protein